MNSLKIALLIIKGLNCIVLDKADLISKVLCSNDVGQFPYFACWRDRRRVGKSCREKGKHMTYAARAIPHVDKA